MNEVVANTILSPSFAPSLGSTAQLTVGNLCRLKERSGLGVFAGERQGHASGASLATHCERRPCIVTHVNATCLLSWPSLCVIGLGWPDTALRLEAFVLGSFGRSRRDSCICIWVAEKPLRDGPIAQHVREIRNSKSSSRC